MKKDQKYWRSIWYNNYPMAKEIDNNIITKYQDH